MSDIVKVFQYPKRGTFASQKAILELYEMRRKGLTWSVISKHFGVSPSTCCTTWKKYCSDGSESTKERQTTKYEIFSAEDCAAIKDGYEAGKSTLVLAKQFGTTSYRIECLLRRMHVELRPRGARSERLSAKEEEALVKFLSQGMPRDEAADELGITYAQVCYFCKTRHFSYYK